MNRLPTRVPQYKLFYFEGRGRAELIRYIFELKGIAYEDIRLSQAEWKKVKPTFPGQMLPVLEVNGVKFNESIAIARYLAREYGLYGNSNMDMFHADVIVDDLTDINTDMIAIFFEKDETKKGTMLNTLLKGRLHVFLDSVESKLAGKECLVGNYITIADLCLYDTLTNMLQMAPKVLDSLPHVKSHRKMIERIPKIKAWIDRRPE